MLSLSGLRPFETTEEENDILEELEDLIESCNDLDYLTVSIPHDISKRPERKKTETWFMSVWAQKLETKYPNIIVEVKLDHEWDQHEVGQRVSEHLWQQHLADQIAAAEEAQQ